jgi:hypothetical protein
VRPVIASNNQVKMEAQIHSGLRSRQVEVQATICDPDREIVARLQVSTMKYPLEAAHENAQHTSTTSLVTVGGRP